MDNHNYPFVEPYSCAPYRWAPSCICIVPPAQSNLNLLCAELHSRHTGGIFHGGKSTLTEGAVFLGQILSNCRPEASSG